MCKLKGVLVVIVLIGLAMPLALADAVGYSYAGSMGRQDPPQYFRCVLDMVETPDGHLYVLDAGDRLFKFYVDGKSASLKFSVKLEYPASSMALLPNGDLVMLGFRECEIRRLDDSGSSVWKSKLPESESRSRSSRIAVCREGNIFVADWGEGVIHRFNPNGLWISKFEAEGSIAFDQEGNLLVGHDHELTIRKFSPDGEFLGKVPRGEEEDILEIGGLFDIAVGENGEMYTCCFATGYISRFDAEGKFLGRIGGPEGETPLEWPRRIAPSRFGIWLASGWPDVGYNVRHLLLLDPTTGKTILQLGDEGGLPDQLTWPAGLAVDAEGCVYVVDDQDFKVVKYSNECKFLLAFGSAGEGDGEFINPFAIALDSTGKHLLVTDRNARVQKFDLSGNYISQFGEKGESAGRLEYPSVIAVDSEGNVYVADEAEPTVSKFDSEGVWERDFGAELEEFTSQGVAVDSDGNLYVSDVYGNRIVKFDPEGELVLSFGGYGEREDIKLYRPCQMAFGPDGNLYVLEMLNVGFLPNLSSSRIQVFDTEGKSLRTIRGLSAGMEDFSSPQGIAIDPSGNIYIADSGRNRIVKLAPSDGPVIDRITVHDIMPTSAQIAWRTDVPSSGRVEFQRLDCKESHVEADAKATQHSFTLTDLEPGALYRARIKSTAGEKTSATGLLEFWTPHKTTTDEAETSARLDFAEDWSVVHDPLASGGAYLAVEKTDDSAGLMLSFEGRSVTVHHIGLPAGGKAQYYVTYGCICCDVFLAGPAGEIDFYAPETVYDRSIEITYPEAGTNFLRIVWVGSSTEGGNTLALDKFEISW